VNNKHGNREFGTLLKLFVKDPNPETQNQQESSDPTGRVAPDPNHGEGHFGKDEVRDAHIS
jgi:hypothetical protein